MRWSTHVSTRWPDRIETLFWVFNDISSRKIEDVGRKAKSHQYMVKWLGILFDTFCPDYRMPLSCWEATETPARGTFIVFVHRVQ